METRHRRWSAATLVLGYALGFGSAWLWWAGGAERPEEAQTRSPAGDPSTSRRARRAPEPAEEAAADTDAPAEAVTAWRDPAERDKPALSVDDHPNVLILMWDTVRADRTSLYGHTRETTPWLQRFARDAVVWDDAVSPSFWTIPSHASIFTGVPASVHRTNSYRPWLRDGYVTTAEWFRDHGYDTWLFSANPNLGLRVNLVQGFEVVDGTRAEPWRAKAIAWSRSKRIARDASSDRSPAFSGGTDVDVNKDAGPVAGEALFAWLDARPDPDRPFLAFVNYMEAHIPRLPTMASREAILDPATLEAGLTTFLGPRRLNELNQGSMVYEPEDREALLGVYDAAIRDLDRATGELVGELERRGLLDDTIVVVVADHGEAFGEHEVYGHNFSVHAEISRVPLVIRYPEALPPGRSKGPVSTAGLYPTLAALAGLPAPPLGMDVPDLREPSDLAVTELVHYHGWNPEIAMTRPDGTAYELRRKQRSVVQGEYEVISASDGSIQLYHHPTDPGQQRDLAEEQADLAQRALDAEEAWRASLPERVPLERGEMKRSERVRGEQQDAGLAEELEALGYAE